MSKHIAREQGFVLVRGSRIVVGYTSGWARNLRHQYGLVFNRNDWRAGWKCRARDHPRCVRYRVAGESRN